MSAPSPSTFATLAASLRRIFPDEATFLLKAFITVVAVWCLIELTDEVVEGDTHAVDRRILLFFRCPDDLSQLLGPNWLPGVARDITALGSHAVLILIGLAVLGYLILRRRFRTAIFVLIASLGGIFMSAAMKELFERTRPDVVPHLVEISTLSYPSGHAMLSAVVYLTLASLLARVEQSRMLRLYFVVVGIVLTLLVGLSRVILGVHYPTDVAAGWMAGLAWATGCSVVAVMLQRRGRIERA